MANGDLSRPTHRSLNWVWDTNLLTWVMETQPTGGGGGGTVTSVGLVLPAELTVTVSPITTSGSLTAIWATETANKVFAGPTSGVPATPAFRLLVAADIPTISLTTMVSGTLPVGNGGTGQVSLTVHGVVVGNAASGVSVTAAGAANTVLHGNGAADPTFSAVVEADITLANNTTNDVSTAAHGFAPKAPNDASLFLNGAAAYSDPFDYLKLAVFCG